MANVEFDVVNSKVYTDQVDPKTGTTLTLGTSGDTVSVPSGVTIANSGTATGFGAALTGSTNNTITTVTGANAIQGEANFTWDGSTCTIQADSSGATTLVVGASDNSSTNTIAFPNLANAVQGSINYLTPSDQMTFCTSSNTERLRILAAGGITFNGETTAAHALDDYEEGTWTPTWTGTGGTVDSTDNSAGNYIKIGKYCWVSMYVAYAHTSGTVTAYNVTNLPFTSATGNTATSGAKEFGQTDKGMTCQIVGASIIATMRMTDTASVSNAYIRASIGYFTA